MGVYIPNMSKPNKCEECELFYVSFYIGEGKVGSACTLNDDGGSTIEADYNACPLIEILRCGECEHWDKEEHSCNIRDSYGWDYKPTDFCSYGERRADE